MRRHHAATSIAAPPDEIWRLLTDGAAYPTLEETFAGPLLPLIGRSLPDMSDAFQGFVTGLKARAEVAPARPSA
jgi:hypothetical protein